MHFVYILYWSIYFNILHSTTVTKIRHISNDPYIRYKFSEQVFIVAINHKLKSLLLMFRTLTWCSTCPCCGGRSPACMYAALLGVLDDLE